VRQPCARNPPASLLSPLFGEVLPGLLLVEVLPSLLLVGAKSSPLLGGLPLAAENRCFFAAFAGLTTLSQYVILLLN